LKGKDANINMEGDILDMKAVLLQSAFIQGRELNSRQHKQLNERFKHCTWHVVKQLKGQKAIL
jgi:hypothetical protein